MDPEFGRCVDAAAAVATSGRWAAANERIDALAADTGPDNAWWVEIFASLCSPTFSEKGGRSKKGELQTVRESRRVSQDRTDVIHGTVPCGSGFQGELTCPTAISGEQRAEAAPSRESHSAGVRRAFVVSIVPYKFGAFQRLHLKRR